MDKTKLARKLMFLVKGSVLIILGTMTLNAFAYKKHHRCCYNINKYYYRTCDTCYTVCKRRPVVCYRGPDCCGYYHGSDCSRIVWVPCHWDVYGNYVPGYWMSLGR